MSRRGRVAGSYPFKALVNKASVRIYSGIE